MDYKFCYSKLLASLLTQLQKERAAAAAAAAAEKEKEKSKGSPSSSPSSPNSKSKPSSSSPTRDVGLSYYTALSNTLSTLVSESQRRLQKLEELYYNESTTPFQITSTQTQYPTSSTSVQVTTHNGCWGGGGEKTYRTSLMRRV